MNLSNLQLPNQKEWAGGVGGLLAFVIILALRYFNIDPGVEVDGALIVALPPLVAKLVPASDQDVLKHLNDTIAQAGTLAGKLTSASDSTTQPSAAAKVLAAKVT